MQYRDAPSFPATAFPQEADQKLLGIYRQRDETRVLQRVRIPGGRMRPEQLAALATIARDAGARSALHLTTRQAVELHDLMPERITDVQAGVAAAGLTVVGAAGDTVRNSTVDPLGGLLVGCADLLPLAQAVEDAVAGLPEVWSLPRKFKISYSGDSRASMRPWFSDVGVIAAHDGHFDVVVAGSLGARPGTGIVAGEGLSAQDTAALAVAAVRLHAEQGDRHNRRTARLRHVRERLGDAAFTQELGRLWDEERELRRTAMPPAAISEQRRDPVLAPYVRLSVPRGDLPIDAALELAESLALAGGEVRLGIEHDLYIRGMEAERLPGSLSAWVSAARLVACPGTALCSKAAGPTGEAADMLRGVAERHPQLLFALSGCPNSCSHAAAAHVGITSRMKRDGEDRVPVFRIAVGGRAGTAPGLSQVADDAVELGELANRVVALIADQGAALARPETA